jgi:hypothetical protein
VGYTVKDIERTFVLQVVCCGQRQETNSPIARARSIYPTHRRQFPIPPDHTRDRSFGFWPVHEHIDIDDSDHRISTSSSPQVLPLRFIVIYLKRTS